jgi:hypothetical protein
LLPGAAESTLFVLVNGGDGLASPGALALVLAVFRSGALAVDVLFSVDLTFHNQVVKSNNFIVFLVQ